MNARMMMYAAAAALAIGTASSALADVVTFKNGDKLTGTVATMDGGKLTIKTAVAGDVTVDLKDVATFATDGPIEIRTADGEKLHEQVTAGDADQIKAGGKVIQISTLKKINPPKEEWHGSVFVNGSIARGNTNTDDLGVSLSAGLRRQNDSTDDRFTTGGAYNLGRQKDPATGDKITTTDNWNLFGKYDRFWTPKFYTYGLMRVEHDRIADLNYRLAPGGGIGYQWIESKEMNFNTEAGITYLYEDYISGGSEDSVAGRLAYHFDKQLNDKVSFFHNLEWLPAFEDPGDYLLNTDAGIRANLTKTFFTEFKVELKRDSSPAPGALKNDLRYILGVGWTF